MSTGQETEPTGDADAEGSTAAPTPGAGVADIGGVVAAVPEEALPAGAPAEDAPIGSVAEYMGRWWQRVRATWAHCPSSSA